MALKTGIFINANLGSKRLPYKHLQIIGKQTALGHLIDRLSPLEDEHTKIYIATGDRQLNAPLGAVADKKNVIIYYGDADNIPLRHYRLALSQKLDAAVSVDGDDLLTSPLAIQDVLKALPDHPLIRTEGLPYGMNVLWAYHTHVLRDNWAKLPLNNHTCWGSIFENPHTIKYDIPGSDKIRATMDFAADLEFFREILTKCPLDTQYNDIKLVEWINQNDHIGAKHNHGSGAASGGGV